MVRNFDFYALRAETSCSHFPIRDQSADCGLVSIERALGHEVLQRSGLARFDWPQRDPQLVDQPTQRLDDDVHHLIRRAAATLRGDTELMLHRLKSVPVAEAVWQILTHREFNFNSVCGVRSEVIWRQRIQNAVIRRQPIRLVYPLFCKIGNWAKQMTATGTTAGEEAVLWFFEKLQAIVQRVYSPGIRIEILADANLYNTALQNTPAEAAKYMADLRRLAAAAAVADFVVIHDYAEILGGEAGRFAKIHGKYYRCLRDRPDQVLAHNTRDALFRSIRASINTRRLGLNYEDHRQLFGPERDARNTAADLVNNLARNALAEQLAIKMAGNELNLPEKMWPSSIRVTCHKGLKAGRHVIGLRVFPTYYRCCRLLPYHGMPLLTRDVRGCWRLEVLPEVSLRGRADLIRVIDEHGAAYCYRELAGAVLARQANRLRRGGVSSVSSIPA